MDNDYFQLAKDITRQYASDIIRQHASGFDCRLKDMKEKLAKKKHEQRTLEGEIDTLDDAIYDLEKVFENGCPKCEKLGSLCIDCQLEQADADVDRAMKVREKLEQEKEQNKNSKR